MGGLSPWHWALVVLAFLLLFGARRLPDAARGLGQSMRIFKAEVGAKSEVDAPAPAAVPTTPVAPPAQQHTAPVVGVEQPVRAPE